MQLRRMHICVSVCLTVYNVYMYWSDISITVYQCSLSILHANKHVHSVVSLFLVRRSTSVPARVARHPVFYGSSCISAPIPASRNKATREMKSPVFKLRPLTSHQSPIHRLHFWYACFSFKHPLKSDSVEFCGWVCTSAVFKMLLLRQFLSDWADFSTRWPRTWGK